MLGSVLRGKRPDGIAMIEKQTKVVWILGAGFSKSLGGPLLGDLLRPYSEETLRQLHDDFFHRGPAGEEEKNRRDRIISGMCNLRFAFVEASQKPGCPWRDAEQFLDLAETAAAESPFGLLQFSDHPALMPAEWMHF